MPPAASKPAPAPALPKAGVDYHRTAHRTPEPPPQGLDAIANTWVGKYRRRSSHLAEFSKQAATIDALAPKFLALTDHQLQEELLRFRDEFRREPKPDPEILNHALAAIREAADRRLGLRAFPVQLVGALALHHGWLAEMATGEGKTLTAGLAGVLAGWTKRPTHIITVNDYLAHRDADWLGPLYTFCGVRVGCVTGALNPEDRIREYGRDVTYTTSKELLADFLRDRLRMQNLTDPTRRVIRRLLGSRESNISGVVLRGLHTAIVDEADSILIDEAVTPLIISTPRKNEMLSEVGRNAARIAEDFAPGKDYVLDLRHREVEFTSAGRKKLEESCGDLPGFWRSEQRRAEIVRTALVAREFFEKDKQYIIADNKVVIVDEATGRPMPQRTWREGLHQAIEAKEGIELSDPSETVARMSFQKFFRCFHRLSGMTGTAWEAAAEFWQIYALPVMRIPTNRPCVRKHLPDRFFKTNREKWDAIIDEILRIHETRRPVLVGTRSVAASEEVARRLKERGVDAFHVLNATRLAEEAMIVAVAGDPARITIATNMAGRGTDIRLGQGVAAMGGLHVLATERHESGRVDRQLFGRAGRQGDPGSAQAFVSAEDHLVIRHLPPAVRKATLSGGPALARTAFSLAQRRAQKLAWRQRLAVLRADAWLDQALSFTGE